MSDETLKNYVDNIENHLANALAVARHMQTHVLEIEGDSDLHRKLAMYLTPNLNHWISGAQAGNMKDLKETLTRRVAQTATNQVESYKGDGHEVLTKPEKK